MAKLRVVAGLGLTLFGSMERESDGFRYNFATQAWANNPSLANLKIPLTEQAAPFTGQYLSSSITGAGDAGVVFVTIHDDTSNDRVLTMFDAMMLGGEFIFDGDALGRNTAAATSIKQYFEGANIVGTVNSVTDSGSFTLTSTDLNHLTDDDVIGKVLTFRSGLNRFLSRAVTLYTQSTKRVQFNGATIIESPFPNAVAPGDAWFMTGIYG